MYAVNYYFDADSYNDIKSSFEAELTTRSINFINRSEADGFEDAAEIVYEITSDDKKSLIDFLSWTHYNIDCAPYSFSEEEAEAAIEEV